MAATPDKSLPSRDSKLTFHEVTKENWHAVASLSVKEEQGGNVAPNVWSLLLSHYDQDAWVRAIYADETPVGMLMLDMWDEKEMYSIWRFMIDARYQGLGYGRRSVQFAIDHVRQHRPQAKLLHLHSTPPEGFGSDNEGGAVPPECSPYKFYESMGFKKIAEPGDDGEVPMAIELSESTNVLRVERS